MSAKNTLPEWLTAELPEPRPTVTISWSDGQFHVTGHPNPYPTIIEAYDTVKEADTAIIFDKSVNGHGGKLYHHIFFCKAEKGKKSARLLISFTDEKHLDILQSDYDEWMKRHQRYEKDPKSWVKAYNWLQHHPLFWHRMKNEKTYHWVTDDGLKSNSVFIWKRNGKPEVHMEHGGHVETDYTTFYHDLKLDTRAKNFEKAYIKLAKLVNKFYNPDGTEKPNVPHKKSYLEKELDKYAETLKEEKED